MEELILEFEEKLKDGLDITLSEEDKTLIRESLQNHIKCIKNKDVKIVWYGDQNITMECENCYEVILDSDVITAEEE